MHKIHRKKQNEFSAMSFINIIKDFEKKKEKGRNTSFTLREKEEANQSYKVDFISCVDP